MVTVRGRWYNGSMTTPSYETNSADTPGQDLVAQDLLRRVQQALMQDDPAMLKAAMDDGMDPYAVRPLGTMDLLSAAIARRQGSKAVRRFLLGSALNLDPTRMGTPGVHTPWHIAARWRDTTAIKAMVKLCDRHGKVPNVNDLDREGLSPLVLALLKPLGVRKPAFDSLHPAAQALIEAGADVNARDHQGQPLYHAMHTHHTHLFKDQRAKLSHLVMLDAFIPAGLDPNARGPHGNTLLHALARTAPSQLPRLLEAGGRLFDLNDAGQTVLDILSPAEREKLQVYIVREEARTLHASLVDPSAPDVLSVEPAGPGRRRL